MFTQLLAITLLLAPATPASLVPERLDGWQRRGQPEAFAGRGLFKAIDGGAEVYLAYGFERLELASFGNGDREVELYYYHMSSPLAAWGIFQRERPRQALAVAGAAAAALRAPHLCTLLKDSLYLKVTARKGKLDKNTCGTMLEAAAAQLPGPATLPAQLALLPAAGRLAGSEGLEPGGYQGCDELKNSLFASYRVADKEYEIFVLLEQGGVQPAERFQKLPAAWKQVEGAPWPARSRPVPYQGPLLLARTASAVVGVSGADNQEEALKVLSGLLAARTR